MNVLRVVVWCVCELVVVCQLIHSTRLQSISTLILSLSSCCPRTGTGTRLQTTHRPHTTFSWAYSTRWCCVCCLQLVESTAEFLFQIPYTAQISLSHDCKGFWGFLRHDTRQITFGSSSTVLVSSKLHKSRTGRRSSRIQGLRVPWLRIAEHEHDACKRVRTSEERRAEL